MSQISGIVKEIFEGTIKKGRSAGQPFWSITLDTDNKLSTFKSEFIQGVEVGKEYTFTVEASGDYVNLTAPTVPCIQNDTESIHADTETIAPEATTAPLTHELPKRNTGTLGTASNKDEAIRKAVALKASVEYVASVLGGTGTTKDVVAYAKEFEEYLK